MSRAYVNRNIDLALYSLNKEYGVKNVTLSRYVDKDTDYVTGVQQSNYEPHIIKRAILITPSLNRTAMSLLTGIFKQGGDYDKTTALLIVRSKLLPRDYDPFYPNLDDQIILDGRTYSITGVDGDYAVVFTIQRVKP